MHVEPGTPKLSRRSALRLLATASGVALLAACQTAAPLTAPTAVPTAAPKPAAPAATVAPAAHAQTAPTAQPTSAAAAAGDRAAQQGFLPAGVGPTSTAPLTVPKGQPRNGGTLREGNLGDLPNLDGHWISGQHTTYPIWDRLVDLDASLQPHPSLAESWEVS